MKKNQTNEDILTQQKHKIKTTAWDCVGASLLFFVFALVGVLLWLYEDMDLVLACGYCLISVVVSATWLGWALSLFSLLKKFKEIEESSNEKSVLINCKKIFFLYSGDNSAVKRWRILGIVMTDEENKKFYYVFPKNDAPLDIKKKEIKNKLLDKRLDLVCYSGTNLVKFSPMA